MRFGILGGIGLLASALPALGQVAAPRPTATYTLVRNDDGTGTFAPRHWAIYADVSSAGYAGIWAFGVDFVDGSVTSMENVSPVGAFVDPTKIPAYRPIGFTSFRLTEFEKAKLSGAQELINTSAVMAYGLGLRDGSLDTAANRPVVPGEVDAWTFEDSVQSSYRAHLLLGVGTFGEVLPLFQDGSPDNVVGVFVDSDGRRSQRAVMTLLTVDLLPSLGQDGAKVPEPASASFFALVAGIMLICRVRRLPIHGRLGPSILTAAK